jgi:hypothetical protein
MDIINAQYEQFAGQNIMVKATINGTEMYVPLDPANTHYDEIMRQVDDGELTIAPAEED